MYNSDDTAGLVFFCPINRNIVFFNLSCPLLGMPQLCVGNQAHPHDWDVASCSQKYEYDFNYYWESTIWEWNQERQKNDALPPIFGWPT